MTKYIKFSYNFVIDSKRRITHHNAENHVTHQPQEIHNAAKRLPTMKILLPRTSRVKAVLTIRLFDQDYSGINR